LITQYKKTGIPITVKGNNCHQPDLPESCNLLAATAIEGKKKASVSIRLNGPSPIKEPKTNTSRNPTMKPNKIEKSIKYQYSDLRALPENSKYLENTLDTASKNPIANLYIFHPYHSI
jgi:hypothetical protein